MRCIGLCGNCKPTLRERNIERSISVVEKLFCNRMHGCQLPNTNTLTDNYLCTDPTLELAALAEAVRLLIMVVITDLQRTRETWLL